MIESAKSDHFNVAERALLLFHNPVLLALLKYDKAGLLPIVVNGMLSNIHRKEKVHLELLKQNGVFVQAPRREDLRGAHWSQRVRGLTIVAMKNLTDHVDRVMVEDIAADMPKNLEQ